MACHIARGSFDANRADEGQLAPSNGVIVGVNLLTRTEDALS